jgi:transposase InsO family protein
MIAPGLRSPSLRYAYDGGHRPVRAATLPPIDQRNNAAQARARVAAWIDEYNRDRKHSSIGMRSPVNHELALRARKQPPRPEAAA